MSRGPLALVAAVLGAGSLARVWLHAGVRYSPADELVYARQACRVAADGPAAYPGLVQDYLADPSAQLYPAPTRWGFVLPDALASSLLGCGQSAVAWVSTLAGVAMLVLVAAFTWRRLGPWACVLATAFVAASPLQLLMSRRALGDELVGVVSLAAIWAVLSYADRPGRTRWLLAVAAVTAGFATKELFVVLYPALAAPLVARAVRDRRLHAADPLLLVVPPVVSTAVLALLARDLGAPMRMIRAVQASSGSAYAQEYLAGPPYRLIVDLLVLAPVVVLVAIASLGLLPDRGTRSSRQIAVALGLSLLSFAFLGVQLVRLVVVSDVLLAVLAAWGLVAVTRGRPWWWAASVAATAVAVDVWVFRALASHGVYDPTTYDVLSALGFLPGR
jgi:hypothetical protein